MEIQQLPNKIMVGVPIFILLKRKKYDIR